MKGGGMQILSKSPCDNFPWASSHLPQPAQGLLAVVGWGGSHGVYFSYIPTYLHPKLTI